MSREPEGPLVAFLDGFARSLRAVEYAARTIHRKVLRVACFSQWLGQREVGLSDLTYEHPVQHVSDRGCRLRPVCGDAAALRHLLDYLRLEGVISAENASIHSKTGVERLTNSYTIYLRDKCGLKAVTVGTYTPFVLCLLRLFSETEMSSHQDYVPRLLWDLFNNRRDG